MPFLPVRYRSRSPSPLLYSAFVDPPLNVEVWGARGDLAHWLVREPSGWFRVPTGPGTWPNRCAVDPPPLGEARRYSDAPAREILRSIGYPLPGASASR